MNQNIDRLGGLVRGLEKLREGYRDIIDKDPHLSVPIDMAVLKAKEKYERVREGDRPLPDL